MKAVLKSIWIDSAVVDLDSYLPSDSQCFGLWVNLRVGPDNAEGGYDYQLLVCTPEWLGQNILDPRWGRHLLIVRQYDFAEIKDAISRRIESCTGEDFYEMATKIARFAAWEFEDYQR